MVNFCEECGAKLSDDAKFCELCGTSVHDYAKMHSTIVDDDIFSSFAWQTLWSKIAAGAANLGVILTDTSNCPNADIFKAKLSEYIAFSKNRGVNYSLLDLASQKICTCVAKSMDDVIKILKEVSFCAKPKYLMLIGNETVFENVAWDNEANDQDKTVLSDLPYTTFDLSSPWQGQKYDFENYTRVGRIPASPDDNFAIAMSYMDNAMLFAGKIKDINGFGITALTWKDESEACFSGQKGVLCCSPDVDLKVLNEKGIVNLNTGVLPNLLYFNLHGSDQTEYWYGQEGQIYPETMEPSVIQTLQPGYFIGVEACYGARYQGLNEKESILLSAISNGCLAFLGSSKIAFGSSQEPGSCADVVVGEFIKM